MVLSTRGGQPVGSHALFAVGFGSGLGISVSWVVQLLRPSNVVSDIARRNPPTLIETD